MKGLTRQIVILLSCAVMIYVNFFQSNSPDLEGAGPEAGASTTYDMFPTAVSPAPYTFAIWLPIFLGMVVFALYQALPAKRHDKRLDALALPVTAAFIANSAQAFTPIGFSVLAIVALLVSLFLVFRVLTRLEPPQERTFNLVVRTPFVMFFSWITVATILNIAQCLVSLNWTGWGIPAGVWGALLILAAASIGFFIVRQYRAVVYGAVLIWAFWGIVAVDPQVLPTVVVTLIATGALVWSMVRAWRSPGVHTASA